MDFKAGIAFDAIKRIMVVSEDAIGPCTRWIAVELIDGRNATIDQRRAISRFISGLRETAPRVAEELSREMTAKDREASYERMIYERPDTT